MSGVSIIIPTYNEEENISLLLEEIYRVVDRPQIIVIDDGSQDRTRELIELLQNSFNSLKLIKRKKKKGIGSAIGYGLRESLFDHIVFMDADFSHKPSDLPRFIEILKTNPIVFGSRFVEGGSLEHKTSRRLGTRFLNIFIKALLGLETLDNTNGYIGMQRKDLIRILDFAETNNILLFNDSFQTKIALIAKKLNIPILEIPVKYIRRKEGITKINSLPYSLNYLFDVFLLRSKSLAIR